MTFNNGDDARVACMWVVEANGSLVDVGNAAGCKRCGRTMRHHNGDASIRASSALCSGRQMTTSMDNTKTPPTQRTISPEVFLTIQTHPLKGFYEWTPFEKIGVTNTRWCEPPVGSTLLPRKPSCCTSHSGKCIPSPLRGVWYVDFAPLGYVDVSVVFCLCRNRPMCGVGVW